MTDQPVEFLPTTVPTPRDIRRDVAAVGRALTDALGLDPDVYEASVRSVPVLDVPMHQDTTHPETSTQPQPFTITITHDGTVVAEIEKVVRWREDDTTNRLDVYGLVDQNGGVVKLCTYAAGTWSTVARSSAIGKEA